MRTPAISSPASMWRSTRKSRFAFSADYTRPRPTTVRRAAHPDLFPQLIALDFAGGGFRKGLAELDPARVLPYPDPLFHMLLQGFGQRVGVLPLRRLLQHDKGFRLDEPLGVGMADDRRFEYRGMAE